MAEPEDKRVIRELIAHVNRIEGRVKDIEGNLSDMNDLQLLNKLDIINLKNELDKIKMVIPGEALTESEPTETGEKPEKRNFKVCEKCGAILPLKAKFCGKCGKEVKG